MAKKEFIKITPESLNMTMVLNYACITEMNGFYSSEVFFTDGFKGDTSYLFQALGNLGSYVREKDFGSDINFCCLSNALLSDFNSGTRSVFLDVLENAFNQNNSPYRKMKLISEEELIWYLENRSSTTEDDQLKQLILKYKNSKKQTVQPQLF